MLKLRDFLHLPQLDTLVEQLVADEPGMIVLAGIDARRIPSQSSDTFTPSGLSAIFNILMQEILLSHPLEHAVVIAKERSLARVPRQLSRRVSLLLVEPSNSYAQMIKMAMLQNPGLLVIDHLTEQAAEAAFRAANSGMRVLAQLDTVLRGPIVARQLIEMGIPRSQLSALRWVLTNQRMSVLCNHCKRQVDDDQTLLERLGSRYPHIRPAIDRFKQTPGDAQQEAKRFYRAGGCDQCHGTGYSSDIAVFDLFRNDPNHPDFFTQTSLLSLEEYALQLATDGQLDLEDLLDLENDHLRRTYKMLTASEQALTEANAALNRKLIELEASNRVLLQRTEVLMSLQDLGQALITSKELSELAERICRRAGELCGADHVVLYLRRMDDQGQASAEILAVRGWDGKHVGLRLDAEHVFDKLNDRKTTRYLQLPPGLRLEKPKPAPDGSSGQITMGLRVPLFAQEQPVGAMIIQCTQKNNFTPGEMALLQTFANQAALAIQRADLVEELRGKITQLEAAQAELVKKERLDRELELARQVQQSMLPQRFPDVQGYVFSARNEPARQVGGDFYDIFLLDEDHFGIVIADVSDKGMPAALTMALTRSLLLAEARRTLSPREALLNVNRLLLEVGEQMGFVSVFYGVVERAARQMLYTRAGHERPMLLRGGEGSLLGGNGTVLGILDGGQLNLSEEHVSLDPGDRLILYTDGLTDVINVDGRFSGLAELEGILHSFATISAEEICESVFQRLGEYRGTAEQFDDMTLLVIQVE